METIVLQTPASPHLALTDLDGEPVPRAQVHVMSFPKSRSPSSTTSDEKGEFRFWGLPEGNYVVTAEADGAEAEAVSAALNDGLDPPRLTLTLRDSRKLAGRVHRQGRPLAGARVVVFPDLSISDSTSVREAHTGVDGWFEAQLPADALFLTLVVVSPGYATMIERTSFPPPGQHLDLPVSPYVGDLSLVYPDPRSLPRGAGLGLPILFNEGAAVPVPLLERALGSGRSGNPWEPVRLRGLAAGSYSFCLGKEATRAWRQGQAPPEAGCSGGYLAPGGELQLAPSLPSPLNLPPTLATPTPEPHIPPAPNPTPV